MKSPATRLHPFEEALQNAWPPEKWADLTVLVAVSGGPDSIALLRALNVIRQPGQGRLCVAHFNHLLREEADADARFVQETAAGWDLPCRIGRAEVAQAAASTGESLEEAARRLRYAFLEETAGQLGARFVVTAHTADDQAETILHRILRGTGIGGLSGMARTRTLGPAVLLRPMLPVLRSEVMQYLRDVGQVYRDDPSNFDARFTRNRLRHELLPRLQKHFNPNVKEALLRLGGLASEVQGLVDVQVEELLKKSVLEESPERLRLSVAALIDAPRYVARESLMELWQRRAWPLQAMGFAQWEQLVDMICSSQETGGQHGFKKAEPRTRDESAGRGHFFKRC